MKRWRMVVAVGAAGLALAGCDSGAVKGRPAPVAVEAGANAETTRYELRLKGVNRTGYEHALVAVDRLEASVGGKPVAVTLQARQLDLAEEEQAHLVGWVDVPRGAEAVHLALRFDRWGGFERAASAGEIDARSAAVEFDAPTVELEKRGRAVVQLDLGLSLTKNRDGSEKLLPNTIVSY